MKCMIIVVAVSIILSGQSGKGENIEAPYSEIDENAISLLEKFKKFMIYPHPELSLPKTDPLDLSNITYNVSANNIRLLGNIFNITVWKMSLFELLSFHVNENSLQAYFDFHLPYVLTNGTFALNGTIGNASPLHGNGSFWFQLNDVNITGGSVHLGYRNDSYFVKKIDFSFTFNGTSGHLYGLESGDKTGEELNDAFLNASVPLINAYKDDIIHYAAKIASGLLDSVFSGRTFSDIAEIISSWK